MTLDPIDITGFRRAAVRDQPLPTNIWVRVAHLVIDRRYQREITTAGRRAIQRIADEWDWKKYQPIIVAPAANGMSAVVDGQHRAHAAAVAGIESIPAMLVPMTPAEQAEGFVSINRDRIRISVHNVYRAELAAGAGWAVRARDLVEEAGCTLSTYTPSARARKPGIVFAVNLIRKMITNGEGDVVTRGLAAIRQSESGESIDSYSGHVLAVWFGALARNQRFLSLDLPAIFDEIDWIDLMDTCLRKSRVTGEPRRKIATDHVVSVLVAHKACGDLEKQRRSA